jgi:hypothetical protein
MVNKFATNESETDRLVRSVLAGILVIVGFFYLKPPLSTVAYALAVVLAITAVTGFCGLYALFGLSTCPVPRKKK